MTEEKIFSVYYRTFKMGQIEISPSNEIVYRYDPRWLNTENAFPLSLSMPLGTQVFDQTIIMPWLANLLPEEQQLSGLTAILGIAAGDIIALLTEIGGDTAGAISFAEPSDPARWSYMPLTEYYKERDPALALEAHFSDLTERPFLAGEGGIRLSLAGGQSKTALTVLDAEGNPVIRLPEAGDQLAIPLHGAPSTIIIKPDNPRLPGIVENELFCLKLAAKIGIDAVNVTALKTPNRSGLCVLRYDRIEGRQNIRRLHQEDFAQILSVPPARKYETGTFAGPGINDLLSVRSQLPPHSGLELIRQVVFNILSANTDAHAKNYSILFDGNAARLAPLYDVSCVMPWRNLHINQTYAQKIAGKKRKVTEIQPRHWDCIAHEAGLNPREMRQLIQDMSARIRREGVTVLNDLHSSDSVVPGFLQETGTCIVENAKRISGRFDAQK